VPDQNEILFPPAALNNVAGLGVLGEEEGNCNYLTNSHQRSSNHAP